MINEYTYVGAERAEGAGPSPLRELTEIQVDRSLPAPLRIRRFADEARDPYRFTVNGTVVRISFSGGDSIDARLAAALSAMTGKNSALYLIDRT